jgi:glucose-6-phosphate isomerase
VKKLVLDYTHVSSAVIGSDQGLPEDLLGQLDGELERAVATLRDLATAEETTFPQLPEQSIESILALADDVRARFDDLVVIGIGGSSLGARAVYRALVRRHSGHHLDGHKREGVRLHFLENVDPVEIDDLLGSLDLDRTAFNVITKSGTTIETMGSFLLVRERLIERFGEEGYRARVIATTDPTTGALRALVQREQLTSLPIPPGVGGRFSVLTAVGLFPLAAAGLDIRGLLRGAASARDNALELHLADNAAAVFAAIQYAFYERGVRECVFMPYAQNLSAVGEWFVQLWAESLGKLRRESDGSVQSVGPTPVPALGVVDQHSQLQLFMEGPPTKNVIFVEVERFATDLTIPPIRQLCEPLAHLGGRTFSQVLAAELAGVREGLAEVGRPSCTLRMERVGPESIGALLMFLECATALAGSLLEIDPFNQPGVELAKRYAHGLLGREKEKHYAQQVHDGTAERTPRQISL